MARPYNPSSTEVVAYTDATGTRSAVINAQIRVVRVLATTDAFMTFDGTVYPHATNGVDDEATSLLMRRVYTHWLEDADNPHKAEALSRAQRDVRETPGYSHPVHWAAFQLVGAN